MPRDRKGLIRMNHKTKNLCQTTANDFRKNLIVNIIQQRNRTPILAETLYVATLHKNQMSDATFHQILQGTA